MQNNRDINFNLWTFFNPSQASHINYYNEKKWKAKTTKHKATQR